MSGKVLYRKYRPTKLADVVGQEQVTATLENALKNKKVGHAYLFIGPRGTGKTSVARIFAHAINKFKYEVEDSYLDIIEIDAASNTGVDNIRELREKAVIAPSNGQYKVYIIDEVHMLTKSASNALLKTLEEPPKHVIFIMATTDAHKVPITISSRTQVFTFKLADHDTMFQHLQNIAKKEKIKITDDALQLVVRRGGGSFRDSLSLLDQITNLIDGEITAEILSHALGLPQDQILIELLNSYSQGNKDQVQQLLKDLLNTGIKPEIIASELITYIINQPETAWLPLLEQLPAVQPPFPEAKLLLALLSNIAPATAPTPLAAAPIATSSSISSVPATLSKPTSTQKPNKPEQTPSNTSSEPQNTPHLASPTSETGQREFSSEKGAGSFFRENDAMRFSAGKSTNPNTQESFQSTTTPEPTTQESKPNAPSITTENFNWETFLDSILPESGAVYQQLRKSDHEITNGTLHIYPATKFTKKVLEQPAHNKIIVQHLGGLGLELHDVGENAAKDPSLSKISAIMGGIQEVKGDLPF